MCGIAGIVNLQSDRPIDPKILQRMVDAMVKRGPDEEGTASTDRAALGIRRLSIIDLEHGSQPIESEDGSVRVVLNGELYSFPEMRSELERLGHTFRTHADTEVLVHGYEAWGIEGLLERLNGMFAFALHDIKSDILYIARDRMGIKPLLYTEMNGKLYFASSIMALLATGQIPAEPDPAGVRLYLHNQYTPAPYTVLAGIRKLPPASLLRIDRGRVHEPVRYWSAPNESPSGGQRDWHGELRELFADAVRCHMISDVEVGLFLSGGLDSSLLLSYMTELAPEHIKAFSISVTHSECYDEMPFARHAAELFGAEFHPSAFSTEDALETASRFIEYIDEPIADAAMLPTFRLSENAARHVKVVLSGEGADELFGGYAYYDRFSTFGGRMKHGLEPVRRWHARLRNKSNVIERIIGRQDRSRSSAYPHPLPAEVCDLMVAGLPGPDATHSLQEDMERLWTCGSQAKGLNLALRADSSGWLPDNLLMKVDRMSMAHSLEARVPFLDYRLVELANQMPASLKHRDTQGKSIVREAFAERLGENLRKRKKHGFNLPIGEWLKGTMRPLLRDTLSDGLPKMPWLDGDIVRQIVDAHMNGTVDMGRQVWQLFVLVSWFSYINGPAAGGRFSGSGR